MKYEANRKMKEVCKQCGKKFKIMGAPYMVVPDRCPGCRTNPHKLGKDQVFGNEKDND